MKKTRMIVAALVVALVTSGAGYAAWTDKLTVNNTVETGNLNVEFISTEKTYSPLTPYSFGLEPNNEKFTKHGIKQTADGVTVNIDNLYPGAGLLYAAQFENKGSIPTIIESVKVEIPNDEFSNLMKDNLVVVGGFIQNRKNNIISVDGGVFPSLIDTILSDSKNYRLKDLEANLNKMLVGKKLMPGDVISFDLPDQESKNEVSKLLLAEGIEGFKPEEHNCIIMGLPKGVGNEFMAKDLATDQQKSKSFQFTIKFNFKQFNK